MQWGLVYVAAAWGLLQGLEYVGEYLRLAEQLRQLALLALSDRPAYRARPRLVPRRPRSAAHQRARAAILALLFLLGGGVFWYYQRRAKPRQLLSPPPTAAAFATDASIAVLPFVNMSADKEQEYFADGISEELLNLLAQVPELRVIARTSSFSFKGKDVDIAEIARRLNVANVLEGSVRKSGDKLRITAQLVRASDSSHLWSQTYDRQMTDMFEVQDEIAPRVCRATKIKLSGSHRRPRNRSAGLRAVPARSRDRATVHERRLRASDRAVPAGARYRSGYAPAWDGLADTYCNSSGFQGLIPFDQGFATCARGDQPGAQS